ncbi:hypothetical protein JNUCC0626_40275 [Lentzea sp. JNUCC 0626]|uniref:hypothetical protein n=1 Tax=Lentzea sp. JNUCC 0626 TaxID=3367513 RepID=UPI0037493C00
MNSNKFAFGPIAFPFQVNSPVCGVRVIEGLGACLANGVVTRVVHRPDGRLVDVFVRLDGLADETHYLSTPTGVSDLLLPRPTLSPPSLV